MIASHLHPSGHHLNDAEFLKVDVQQTSATCRADYLIHPENQSSRPTQPMAVIRQLKQTYSLERRFIL